MVKATCLFVLLIWARSGQAQRYDTLVGDSLHRQRMMVYNVNGEKLLYPRPKIYSFITKIPATFRDAARESFQKKSLPAWGVVVGTTAVLILCDQYITDESHKFANYIGLDPSHRYKDLITIHLGGGPIHVYQAPQNLNSFLYSMGEGLPPILIGAGLLVHGAIKNDYRAMSTASQILQSNITMGIATQAFKRIAGRQSPIESTQTGGAWHPLASFKKYQGNTPYYDAFPSGHMGTLMSTVTVLAMNYPEKKWIKPVGYAVMAIVGFAMVNNDVHWTGDYPLAIGLGYVCAKATVNLNRFVNGSSWKRR
jgi:hypothetical protein